MSPWYLIGLVPFAAVSAVVGWIMAGYTRAERLRREQHAQADRLSVHQDDLTFQLLTAARGEVTVAYEEMKTLRDEVKTLRELEQHFFHFQQALDHLEAILYADTPELKSVAERNAKAFLTRMRRLNEAKGTIRNEVQTAASGVRIAKDKVYPLETGPLDLQVEPEDIGGKDG